MYRPRAGAPQRRAARGRARLPRRAAPAPRRSSPLAPRAPLRPARRRRRAAAEDAPRRRARTTVVALRFAWPAPARARVTYRRTRLAHRARPRARSPRATRPRVEPSAGGAPRHDARRRPGAATCPFARGARARTRSARRRQVVQRVGADGEFVGLDGVEALRPVLARVLDDAKVPPEQAERALALAARRDARRGGGALEPRRRASGPGRTCRLGETYAMQSEAELPAPPRRPRGAGGGVRRAPPRARAPRPSARPRCVEAVAPLDAGPRRARARGAARSSRGSSRPGPSAPEGAAKELTAESELLLVTDPATLLPRRLVWTKAVRLGGARRRARRRRSTSTAAEYDYRWLPPEPPPRRARSGRRPRRPRSAAPAPTTARAPRR